MGDDAQLQGTVSMEENVDVSCRPRRVPLLMEFGGDSTALGQLGDYGSDPS